MRIDKYDVGLVAMLCALVGFFVFVFSLYPKLQERDIRRCQAILNQELRYPAKMRGHEYVEASETEKQRCRYRIADQLKHPPPSRRSSGGAVPLLIPMGR